MKIGKWKRRNDATWSSRREIEAAVEAGKLSKEDAEKRLIAVRKEMFKQDGSEDREE